MVYLNACNCTTVLTVNVFRHIPSLALCIYRMLFGQKKLSHKCHRKLNTLIYSWCMVFTQRCVSHAAWDSHTSFTHTEWAMWRNRYDACPLGESSPSFLPIWLCKEWQVCRSAILPPARNAAFTLLSVLLHCSLYDKPRVFPLNQK